MESSYRLAVERVRANAERIRRVELPAYEQLINVRAKRYRLLADVYARLRRRRDNVTPTGEYCAWSRLLDAADQAPCVCSDGEATMASGRDRNSTSASWSSMPVFDGCDLPPVEPLIHHRSSVIYPHPGLGHSPWIYSPGHLAPGQFPLRTFLPPISASIG